MLLHGLSWAGWFSDALVNIDLKRNQITYIPIKTMRTTGKRVVIPLPPDFRPALEDAQAWRDTNLKGQDYILPAIAKRSQYNPSGIQKDVMKVIRCATGLDTNTSDTPGKRILKANLYSLHSFRHTFVSFCANAGVSLDIVAEVVGHGSPVMTRHYAHISDTAKQAIIKALPNQRSTEDDERLKVKRLELQQMFPDLTSDKIEEMLKIANQ